MPDLDAVRVYLEERHFDFAERAEAWIDAKIATRPHATDDEDAREEARKIARHLGADGWFAPIVDRDFRACGLMREALARVSPLADAVYALQALGTTPVLLAGDDDLKRRWADRAVAGDAVAAFAMTEPDAGSDIASLSTTATLDAEAGEYVLEGRKTLISNAGLADFYVVFASTDPDRGAKGISAFVVPGGTSGLEFVRAQVLSEPHPLGELAFRRCRIPETSRLGEEGDGWRIGLATLDALRPTVAAAACGMSRRAIEEAVAHARKRYQFGKRLADFQLVQDRLARMVVDLEAARLLTYRALAEKDRGRARITREASIAKAFATEAAQRIVDGAVQILGGKGVLADQMVDRLYRSVRALRIYEGTTEIQHLVIAGQLLREADAADPPDAEDSDAAAAESPAGDGDAAPEPAS